MDTDIIKRYDNGERVFSQENLYQAKLAGAGLSGANLHEANLYEADLSGADLSYCDLRRANLCGANLRGANLTGADLTQANLHLADATDAIFEGACIVEANTYQTIGRERIEQQAVRSVDWTPPAELRQARVIRELKEVGLADVAAAVESVAVKWEK